MRVAMLGLYPPDPQHILGGVEAVTYLLGQYVPQCRDVDLHVATFRPDITRPRQEERDGLTLYLFPTPRWTRSTWHWAGRRVLRELLDHLHPDVVHAHGSTVYTAAAVRAPYPHVVTVHGVMAREAPTVWGWRRRMARELDRWFERWALRQAREIIAISPYIRDAYPWLRARLHFIENPVDPRYFNIPVDAAQPGNVLTVARVIPRKGILPLIRAFARVAGDFPPAELHIAGEMVSFPEYAAACQAEVRKHGLSHRVHFLGPLDTLGLLRAYEAAQVTVLASLQETAPIVIGESMAAARPVIATAVGGVPHMIAAGRTGWLVPLGDEIALANALADALAHPERSREMGHRAREEALARFHPQPIARRHVALYRTLASISPQEEVAP